jgi:hypothetical protein
LKISVLEIDSAEFVKYLESEAIFVKAYGDVDNVLKIYLFSQDNITSSFYLAEVILDFNKQMMSYTIKTENKNFITKYEEYFLKVLEPIL